MNISFNIYIYIYIYIYNIYIYIYIYIYIRSKQSKICIYVTNKVGFICFSFKNYKYLSNFKLWQHIDSSTVLLASLS